MWTLLALAVAPVLQDAASPDPETAPAAPVPAALEAPGGAGSTLPSLARGADGRVRLSWAERVDAETAVLRFAVLEEPGWSAPREIVRGDDLLLNWADFPSLAALESGVLAAQWLRLVGDGHGYHAMVALSADGGATWSEPRRLHADASHAEHGFVSLLPLDGERFGALWLDGRETLGRAHGDGETALFFRTLAADGSLGHETLLDPRVCDCCQTSLVATGAGALAVYRDRSDDEVRDVSWVRLDGGTWTEPRAVHADGWRIEGCPVNGPRVARRGERAVAAWFTGVGGGGGEVRLAFGDAEGFDAPVRVDDGRPVGRAEVVALADGGALALWLEHVEAGRAAWRMRRVARTGLAGDSVKIADVASDRASGSLRAVLFGDEVILAWVSDEGGVRTARAALGRALSDR